MITCNPTAARRVLRCTPATPLLLLLLLLLLLFVDIDRVRRRIPSPSPSLCAPCTSSSSSSSSLSLLSFASLITVDASSVDTVRRCCCCCCCCFFVFCCFVAAGCARRNAIACAASATLHTTNQYTACTHISSCQQHSTHVAASAGAANRNPIARRQTRLAVASTMITYVRNTMIRFALSSSLSSSQSLNLIRCTCSCQPSTISRCCHADQCRTFDCKRARHPTQHTDCSHQQQQTNDTTHPSRGRNVRAPLRSCHATSTPSLPPECTYAPSPLNCNARTACACQCIVVAIHCHRGYNALLIKYAYKHTIINITFVCGNAHVSAPRQLVFCTHVLLVTHTSSHTHTHPHSHPHRHRAMRPETSPSATMPSTSEGETAQHVTRSFD